MNEKMTYLVLEIVKEIPQGKVLSYGRLAKMAGYPKNARLVGKILSNADFYGRYPCHRVVHSNGALVIFWQEQKSLLEKEGVTFKTNGMVDMKKCQWGNEDETKISEIR